MHGYAGSDHQQQLQRATEAAAAWLAETPGACNAGRILGTDDPDTLGWDTVAALLAEHGALAFRMVPVDVIGPLERRLADAGASIDFWDVFEAPAPVARQYAGIVLLPGVPEGYERLDQLSDEQLEQAMELMIACGIVPFSAAFLAGRPGPAVTVALRDLDSGQIVATAHAYLPHNRHSPHAGNAWAGLVAVAERHRGRGLGKWINAAAVLGAVETLGASAVHELVSAENKVSRRMVRDAGLRLVTDRKCGIATMGGGRYTA